MQSRQSIENSLFNLRPRAEEESVQESYIDVLFLHFPLPTLEQTLSAWATFQAYCPSRIRRLGLSNTSPPILQALLLAKSVTVKPSVIQNRFYSETLYDQDLREACRVKGIEYQCFGVLKSNAALLQHDSVLRLASEAQVSTTTVLYFLVFDLAEGLQILNGTREPQRMLQDRDEMERLQTWVSNTANRHSMEEFHRPHFRTAIRLAGNG